MELDFSLAEILAYLQVARRRFEDRRGPPGSPHAGGADPLRAVLRGLKAGWTRTLREQYFRWFVTDAAAYRGGNTFTRALQTIKAQAIDTLGDEERTALKPILDAEPARKSTRELLADRKLVKEWKVAELVPIVELGLRGSRDLDRGRRLYGAVACASCHRFGGDGGGVGPDLTSVAGRFGVRDLLDSIVEPSKVVSSQYAAISIITKDGKIINGRVANLSGNSLNVVEDMFDPGRVTNVRRSDIEEIKPSEVSVMPAGLLNSLTEGEIQDLVAFLLASGDSRNQQSRP